jgi:DNA-binding YbaB/EbfC family protein
MNYKNIMQQAKVMQEQMLALQEKLKGLDVTGTSGGGLVKITLTGQGMVSQTQIDTSLLKEEEKEVLEDLVSAAFRDARQKLDALTSDQMSKVTGGLGLPQGFGFP